MPNQNSGAFARHRAAAVEYLKQLDKPARKSAICRACNIPFGSMGAVFYGCDLFVVMEDGLLRFRRDDEPVQEQGVPGYDVAAELPEITEFTLDDLRNAAIDVVVGEHLVGSVEIRPADNDVIDALLCCWLYELRTPTNEICQMISRPISRVKMWLYRRSLYRFQFWADSEHPAMEMLISAMAVAGELIVSERGDTKYFKAMPKNPGRGWHPPRFAYYSMIDAVRTRWSYDYREARRRLNRDLALLGIKAY